MKSLSQKKKILSNKTLYTKQGNFCVFLLWKTKKNHYVNVNHKDIADKKQFWRTVKPLLSDKSKSKEKQNNKRWWQNNKWG